MSRINRLSFKRLANGGTYKFRGSTLDALKGQYEAAVAERKRAERREREARERLLGAMREGRK